MIADQIDALQSLHVSQNLALLSRVISTKQLNHTHFLLLKTLYDMIGYMIFLILHL